MHEEFSISEQYLPNYSSSLPRIFANIRTAKKTKAAVYHITGDIHYVALGLPRKKTVLTIHDCVFLQQASGIKRLLLKWIWLDWPVRAASIITTISESTKQEILRHTGVRPGKVLVIPNPVGRHIRYREKEFAGACPVILFIGSTANKNLDRVITALQGIGCILEIIGKISDNQQERLETLSISYRLFQGLSDEALAERYTGCDLLLFPSTYEGFGLPIVEAQQAGRPVITSDLSPMKEVAGGAACLVDPYSPESIRAGLLRVINDKPFRDELVKEGFDNVARYDSTAIARQYMDCYKKLIDKVCAV